MATFKVLSMRKRDALPVGLIRVSLYLQKSLKINCIQSGVSYYDKRFKSIVQYSIFVCRGVIERSNLSVPILSLTLFFVLKTVEAASKYSSASLPWRPQWCLNMVLISMMVMYKCDPAVFSLPKKM